MKSLILAALLMLGFAETVLAEGHDGVPSRRSGSGTRWREAVVAKQPPVRKLQGAIVVTPLFAVMG